MQCRAAECTARDVAGRERNSGLVTRDLGTVQRFTEEIGGGIVHVNSVTSVRSAKGSVLNGTWTSAPAD